MSQAHVQRARNLVKTPLFQRPPDDTPVLERINIAHERAKAIGLAYDMTADDVNHMSRKFWDLHTDPITCLDGAADTVLLIQYNLVAGTLSPFARDRVELAKLLDDILKFRVGGLYLMSEVGHGLDAINLETTATLRSDGTFDLFTPNDGAAKYMPPTLPAAGIPRVGLVLAKLIISGVDHGIRVFLTPMYDGEQLCANVVVKELPTRNGAKPIGHTLTWFNHVILPSTALLGELSHTPDPKKAFLACARRIGAGSIATAALTIPALRVGAYIVSRYSQRRMVRYSMAKPVPILTFRTQQMPIAYALAQASVLDALYVRITEGFTYKDDDCLPAIIKALAFKFWRKSGISLTDRLGAQGLFDFNQLIAMDMEWRGCAIAEGDALVLGIRCAFEIALGKFALPPAAEPSSWLARHERGLLQEFRNELIAARNEHRSNEVNQKLMPRCFDLVHAVGERMAYDAARAAKVPQSLIDLHEAGAILSDSAWYVECAGLARLRQLEMEEKAVNSIMAHLETHLSDTGVHDYTVAAILTEESWNKFVSTLNVYSGNGRYNPLAGRAHL